MSTVLGRFLPAADAGEPELEPLLREYVASQASLQIVQTRSGGLCDGGLGEPKFTVEGAAFEGDWGRPQRVRLARRETQRLLGPPTQAG